MLVSGVDEDTRNGPAKSLAHPSLITVNAPQERVLMDAKRDANPFFHVMEFVWMMAGMRDVSWVGRFNKNMLTYTEPNSPVIHGAYGHRWRRHFARDQLFQVVRMLRQDPTTRRAVLGMWDPRCDLDYHTDLPCNTHIYFRYTQGKLDMTVCNRSNDLIWGLCGANIVHMTLLHQLISEATGLQMGRYHVFTNNLHIYKDVPEYNYFMEGTLAQNKNYYGCHQVDHIPLTTLGESGLNEFLECCEEFVLWDPGRVKNEWLRSVARPMHDTYLAKGADRWAAAQASYKQIGGRHV
jgi:hypothetical protein